MSIDSINCVVTYNLTCVDGTHFPINSSSNALGDMLHSNLLSGSDHSNSKFITSSSHPIPSTILVSVQHCIITAIILGAIILSTITGNILVIAAVILDKTLHSVAYYLFVSLAVADLMVATMVS